MTSYQVLEFLESLPKQGIIEINHEDVGEFYIVSSTATYEAVGDDAIKVVASLGYGMVATVPSHLLLDVDGISAIRHTNGSME